MAATAQVGALNVAITATTKGLKTSVKQAGDVLNKGRKTLDQNAGKWAKWGSAVVAANAIAAAAIFKTTSQSIDGLAKTSDKLGITTEALTGLRLAAEQTGVSYKTFDMALQRMTRRLAEAGQGGGEAKAAIEELGLSAKDLAAQSPDEALKTIADAMQGVESQSDKVRLAFKFFDSEGVALVNTLSLGSEGLTKFEKDAQALGITISRVDASKVEAANDALNVASKVVGGALKDVTIELAPLVTALTKEFTKAAKEAGGFSDAARDGMNTAVNAIGFVMDAADGISRVFEFAGKGVALFALGVKEAMITAAEFIVNRPVQAVNELIEAMNQLPLVDVEPVGLSGLGKSLEAELQTTRIAVALAMADMGEIFDRPMPSEGLKTAVAVAREAAEEMAKLSTGGDVEDDGDKLDLKIEKMTSETEAILEALQTRYLSERELEDTKFAEENTALSSALAAKAITQAQYDALSTKRKQEHDKKIAKIENQAQQMQLKHLNHSLNAAATLLTLGGKKSEKSIRNLGIASAVIKGYEAAASAWAAGMSTGGPWAPAVAASYTAASIVKTGKMISALKSGSKSKPSGGGGVPSVPSGRSSTTSSSSGFVPPTTTTDTQAAPAAQRTIDVRLIGEIFNVETVRDLMGRIAEEVGNGTQFNVIQGA